MTCQESTEDALLSSQKSSLKCFLWGTGRMVQCWMVTVSLNKIIFFLSWLDREPKQDMFMTIHGNPMEDME